MRKPTVRGRPSSAVTGNWKLETGTRRSGFAFVAVLLVMVVMAILITGVLAVAFSARGLSASRHEYSEALYVAEAGINKTITTWRRTGVPATIPGAGNGTITDRGRTGSYQVSWDYWHPYGPNDPFVRTDVIVLTSQGTINTHLSNKTALNVSRTIQVNFDTDGDWGWNHVYYTDDPDPQYQVPPFADVNGSSGEIIPLSHLDAHGPGAGDTLPTPKWDEWLARASKGVSDEDPTDDDVLPYPSALPAKADASEARHVYWKGASTAAHTGAGHTHYNYFVPDPYFPGLSYPVAYGCSDFTVTFTKHNGVDYSGVYYVHGNVIVKNGINLTGTIVATGDISFQGQGTSDIRVMIENQDDCAARTVYPALIAGRDIEIRDQSIFHTNGIIWAGRSFTAKAADQAGCIVAPHITLTGNFSVNYGFETTNPECPVYEPGNSPPPMFNEPDKGVMQPLPHSWREL
ncbi:MAG: hypothetical protein ACE149_04375 [Armatimonadota bacterium]